MSRVLLTGAGGSIGRHALAPLIAAGLEAHALTSRRAPTGLPTEVRWHRADLLAPDSCTALIEQVRPTHLLHLAWFTEPGAYWTAGENLDWAHASLRLLRAFGELGGRRAVIAGTCAEYAWQAYTHCVETETPTKPATPYGSAKHDLRLLADAWARQAGVELAWGRIFHVYGPHERQERLVGGLASALLRGEEATCSHGRQVRDFLYAPELASAFVALLASDVTGPVNMASGRPVPVADLVMAVAESAGRPELVRLGARPLAPGEPERLTAEVRRLREEVGWVPAVGLREGAERTVKWWRRALARTLEAAP
jgi:nucleoside-diphosphate-sugar epimerase